MSLPDLNPATLTAMLGPTNTGKTHYAVERMLARSSGVIGLPLRLLAREVYDRIVAIKGPQVCALLTGEEKIVPPHARYFVCTVEAMPVAGDQRRNFAFVAVDEIQLIGHPERGHVFTDRLLHARGSQETIFLGADTVAPVIRHLLPEARIERRERFSTLSYAGPARLTRLPKRSVIVAFSASEVYALAELIRRYRGGAAVVMGALSPRTRNAQAALFQSGEVDFLIATDAVGMGLNLDTDHVAFASRRKYDGHRMRRLTPMEAGQIAGRAGRFRNDGTFGSTGDCEPFDDDLIAAIEAHRFEPQHTAWWRNSDLDFSSIAALDQSLHVKRPDRRLRRVRPATDELAFERMRTLDIVIDTVSTPRDVKRLWNICQVPDFRDLTIDAHVRLLQDLYGHIVNNSGRIPADYLHARITGLDDPTGGVAVLSARLARIRTWTYVANAVGWTRTPARWQTLTREVEDRLSDALHESLTARFVDRRTSALLKGIGTGALMDASIRKDGEVWVTGLPNIGGEDASSDQMIGHLRGLSFVLDGTASDLEAKALEQAAAKVVGPEVDRRLTSIASATQNIFTLSDAGEILWGGEAVGRIAPSGSIFTPAAEMIGGQLGNPALAAMAEERMSQYLQSEVAEKLAPLASLKALSDAETTLPAAKGFAFEMLEAYGSVARRTHYKTINALEQDARAQLRSAGVVFGQYDVFLRDMVKPKPATLLGLLHAFGAGGDRKPFIPFAGVTSLANAGDLAAENYSLQAVRMAGYHPVGPRIIRFDILERFARMLRDAQSQTDQSGMPRGARSGRFRITQNMLALLGCTLDEVRGVLRNLGFSAREDAELAAREDAVIDIPPADPTVPKPAVSGPVVSEPAVPDPAVPESAAPPAETPPAATSETPASDASAQIPEAPASETTSATPTPEPGAPKPKSNRQLKREARKRMDVYRERVTAEDGTVTELPNTEYWSLAQRQKRPPRGQNTRKPKYKGKPKRDYPKGDYKGGFQGKSARADARSGKPKPKPATEPEDSPFAALAALKLDKKN